MNWRCSTPWYVVMAVAALGSIALVTCGRFATFHDTEMEALVNGWPYWGSSFGFLLVALVAYRVAGDP